MSEQRWKTWISDPLVVLIVCTITSIATTAILAELQAVFGVKEVLLSSVLLLLVFAAACLTVMVPIRASLERGIDKLSVLVEPKSISWLKDTNQLVEYEKQTDAKEIWLLTSDLLDDVGGPFQQLVMCKLDDGVKYVYFVPDTSEIRARVEIVKSMHHHHRNLLVKYLPNNFFLLVSKLDIVVYDPLNAENRSAYMGIPDSDEKYHFHAKVSLAFVDNVVGVLLRECPEISGSPTGTFQRHLID